MRNRLFAAATALIALIVLPAGTAGAMPRTPARPTVGGPLSTDLAYDDATLFYPGTTSGTKCAASHLGGTLAVNPSSPGTLSGPVNVLTFSSCVSNTIGVTAVISLTVDNLPYTLAIADTADSPLVLAPTSGSIQTTVVLKTLAGVATCVYRANFLNGNLTNNLTQITLVKQLLTKSSGPSICYPSLEFTASYGPVNLFN
ncbi:Tat pathway signal sequence domain protein [Kitasatospora sp. NPDC051984]|uniref:Tat pathway signal sequence domain protein n=1 Tax=Kitasatospora sp. NPDC051984 TaxID=3364059 RepID=UPI0037CC29EF